MSQVTATVDQAAQWAGRAAVPPAQWNPVYRALAGAQATTPGELPGRRAVDLVRRQLTAPALLTVAVTTASRTARLRIGADPVLSTRERSEGDLPSQWSQCAAQVLPGIITDLLEDAGVDLSPALTLHDPQGLRLEQPVTWSRLWATGQKGLYRLDQPEGPGLAVQAVGGGDLLGTVLPVLEQALRFAGDARAAGAAR